MLSQAQNRCMVDPGASAPRSHSPFCRGPWTKGSVAWAAFKNIIIPAYSPSVRTTVYANNDSETFCSSLRKVTFKCIFFHTHNKTGIHPTKLGMCIQWDLWILKVHIHLKVAGIKLHVCMNGETTHTALVKPQCLHTGHPKQFSSQWEVSWNNNTLWCQRSFVPNIPERYTSGYL